MRSIPPSLASFFQEYDITRLNPETDSFTIIERTLRARLLSSFIWQLALPWLFTLAMAVQRNILSGSQRDWTRVASGKQGKMINEQKEPERKKSESQPMGYWIGIGLVLGAGIGVALDSLAMGIAIGFLIGVAIGAWQSQEKRDK